MALIQLIYVSAARHEMSGPELDDVLASSVRNNTRQDVTGMLLYSQGSFIQVLEGEEAAVDETYARVSRDPRHHMITVLSREQVAHRDFPSWGMGFRRLRSEDAIAHPAYAPFFSAGFDAAAIGAKPGVALDLLKDFARR